MRAVTLAVLGALICATPTLAEEIPLSSEQLRTYTLFSQGQQLPQPVVVYRLDQRHLVPLQALSAAIGMDIRVDPKGASATGWISGENSNFLLDLQVDEARRGFERFELDPAQPWGRDSADLYLDAELISQILPLELRFHNQSGRLNVSSEYPLPIVQQIEQQHANEASLGQQQNFHSGGLDPIHPHDYAEASPPTVLGFINSALIGDELLTQDYRLGLISTGDLAGQSYEFNYTKLAQQRSEYRLRLSRDLGDVSESLPFDLGQYQLGDITQFGDNLLAGTREGLGFALGNAQQQRFGVTSLEGNAPPDWQVHLYRNGVLLGFTQAADSGRYRFTDVALLEGVNVFELHLYGNNGEHHVRRQTVDNRRNVRRGQFSYQINYIDNTRFVFNRLTDSEQDALGAQRQLALRANYGLTDTLDLGVSYQQQKLEQDEWGRIVFNDVNYFGVHLGADLFGTRVQLEAISDDESQTAYFAGLSRGLGANHQLRLSHRNHGELQADRTEQDELPLNHESTLWLEGQTWRLGGWQYAFGGSWLDPQEDAAPDSFGRFENRLSTQLGPVHLTHHYRYDAQYDTRLERQSGEVLLSTLGNGWNLSSQVEYQFGYGVTDMETRMRWRPWYEIYNQTLLWYQNPLERKSRFGIGHEVAYRYRWLTLGLQGGIDTRGDWQINTTASFSLNHDDNRGALDLTALRPQQADMAVRVFIDSNNNGRFDRSDQPLAGISIDTAPSWPREASDDSGEILLRQLPAQNRYRISIDPRNLPQGLVLRDGPVDAMPLVGQRTEVELALVWLTEVHGQIQTEQGQIVDQLRFTLTDLDRRPVAQVRSDDDGQFRFEVKPGNYYLVPDEAQLRQQRLRSPVPVFPLNIGADGEQRDPWTIELTALAGSPYQAKDTKAGSNAAALTAPLSAAQPIVDAVANAELPGILNRAEALPTQLTPLARINDSDFVLQLAASRDTFDLAALRNRYPAQSLLQITVMRGGKPMNLLLAGQYPSRQSAQLGGRGIPSSLSNGTPIIRRVADLKRESLDPQDRRNTAPAADARAPAATGMISAPTPATPVPPAPSGDWLSRQPDQHVTWQLAATRSADSAQAFIRQNGLEEKGQVVEHNGWYQVLWGSFADRDSAYAALDALDKPLQNPWLRPFSALR
ncbi:SPOR domain-containing protein [Ferrimonas pelagia]|uniref:SPOR domain-containing protein n=1 Tax=Ferrimonas pelagia TaxID=1177826 RepID=A0ABP9FEH9_9GAMM